MPRSSSSSNRRAASHAGSWYENREAALTQLLERWLSAVPADPSLRTRAVIAPHAGHSYCGHVMAHCYRHLDVQSAQTIFILGPSHHKYTPRCALSQTNSYETPLGDLSLNAEIVQALRATGKFEEMSLAVDEAEHSMELHLPFIAHIMRGKSFTIVPILVGALSPDAERQYGELLAPYLDDPASAWVVSSDFCHWGQRFGFTPHDPSQASISASIEQMDREGMALIEEGRPEAFTAYLQRTGNTICGRHPIGVFLQMSQHSKSRPRLRFLKYAQSSACQSMSDSSVSYAAAVALPP